MSDLPKQFEFLAGLFIDFNESVDNSVVAPAPLSPKRALGHFLFYSKGGERILFLSFRPQKAPNQQIFAFAFQKSCSDKVLCNPNPFYLPNPFLPLVPAVLFPTRDIMLPKSGRPLFFPHPQDPVSTVFPGPLFRPRSSFFAPNLNLYLALLSAILLSNIFLLSWLVDSIFVDRSIFKSDVTDKRKPFERMGRKTSDLSNGSWVTQVTSGLFLAHSFEAKNGLFVYGPSYRGGQL